MDILDVLILICGCYILYQAYIMKKEGTIPDGVLTVKGMMLAHNADIPGFIRAMFGKTVLLGIFAILAGLTGLLESKFGGFGMISVIINVAFFVLLVVFIVWNKKAQDKFLKP